MRTTIAAASFVFVFGVAHATEPGDSTAAGKAYFGFSFGGERLAPRALHYGLRLDRDAPGLESTTTPLAQLEFSRHGLRDARVNGMSVLRTGYRLALAQDEAESQAGGDEATDEAAAEAEEPAEEQGFFGRLWSNVKNFFGAGDDDTETAAADEEAEEVTEGAFLGYNALDWGLLAVGAAGLGFAVSEISNGEEDPDPRRTTSSPGSGGGTICVPTTTTCPALTASGALLPDRMPVEYQEWLDAGTGHMGDLGD